MKNEISESKRNELLKTGTELLQTVNDPTLADKIQTVLKVLDGKTCVEVAKSANVDESTIRRRVKAVVADGFVGLVNKKTLRLRTWEEISNEKNVAKCLRCGKALSHSAVVKKQMFCSKACATSYRCAAHDPDLFDIPVDDVKYYVLGYLYTDGNLNMERTKLTLASVDKEMVEFVYPYFCDTEKRKIYSYKPSTEKYLNPQICYSLVNSNRSTINKMEALGFEPCNSLTKPFPPIPKTGMKSFLRGVFDADGSVSQNKNGSFLIAFVSGSKQYAEGIYENLISLELKPTFNSYKRAENLNVIYKVNLFKQDDIDRFFHMIYDDASVFIRKKHDFYYDRKI